ncbi:hypothetical protein JOM56_012712 [Amanita muscaria]
MEHRWFLAVVNVPQEEKRRRREELQIRGHDQYQELVNTKVVIGGQHQEKGLRGNIRAHLGRCIMRVELESGARMADVHVNFLFPTLCSFSERGGRDPRDHHVGQIVVPRDAVYSWPQPAPQPQIHTWAATPIPAEQPDPDTIEYDGQDEPGFMKGRYEGSRALTLGLNVTGAVNVHVKKDTVVIPCHYLFLEHPASMGQKAVVISGEHVGILGSAPTQHTRLVMLSAAEGSDGAEHYVIPWWRDTFASQGVIMTMSSNFKEQDRPVSDSGPRCAESESEPPLFKSLFSYAADGLSKLSLPRALTYVTGNARKNVRFLELFTLSHAFQQDVTRNPGGIPACYKDVTGIPGKFLVVNLAGNTAKNYQESTKTPEGCYQEFLVKCKDVRGNYQDSLYLD